MFNFSENTFCFKNDNCIKLDALILFLNLRNFSNAYLLVSDTVRLSSLFIQHYYFNCMI